MEERGILGKIINFASHFAENYYPHQKKHGYSGSINSNNGETVLLSEIKQILKHVK